MEGTRWGWGGGALRQPLGQALEPPGLIHAPSTPQVYHMLFGPSPALDVGSGLPRSQEPWTNPLFRMEVRGPLSGIGVCCLPLPEWVTKEAPLIIPSFSWGVREVSESVTGMESGKAGQ